VGYVSCGVSAGTIRQAEIGERKLPKQKWFWGRAEQCGPRYIGMRHTVVVE